jgi:hypothetical protein
MFLKEIEEFMSINVRNVKGFRSADSFTINVGAGLRRVKNSTLRPFYSWKRAPKTIEKETMLGP